MRQRFVRIDSRNAGVVVTVSDRALSVRVPMVMSLAQDGISPQRIVVKCLDFLPFCLRTVRTGCVGAMLYRGRSSISPSGAPKRSARYCFERVSRYRLHTSSLSQIWQIKVVDDPRRPGDPSMWSSRIPPRTHSVTSRLGCDSQGCSASASTR